MANQDVKVSALNSVSTLSTEDLSLETVVDELSETGYTSKKITEGAKATQYLEAFTFANLNTTAKTIVGAINEAATTGAGDFPIHIHNSTITETAGEVLDAMADGLRPYVIWTNNSQSNYTFTYALAAVWNPDATTETLIFGCPITGAVRTIHVYINPTTRTYSSSISIVDYNIPQINDSSTSSSSVWSSQKTASELADKAEIDDTAVSSSTAWSSEQIVSLLPTESASGAVASFETPLTLPLVSHIVTIEPVQAGTGDPSPVNPCPISGRSAVNVTRLANLTSPSDLEQGTFNSSNGQLQPSTTRLRMKSSKQINAGSYTIEATGADDVVVYVYNLDGSWISAESVVNWQSLPYTFTLAGARLVNFALRHSDNSTITTDEVTKCFFYANSSKATYNIPLGQTVYGGEVDLTNGVLRITDATEVYDGSDDEDWQKLGSGSASAFAMRISIANLFEGGVIDNSKLKGNYLKTIPSSETWGNFDNFITKVAQINRIVTGIQSITTVANWKAYLSEHPLSVCYKLATPIEVQLTPEQLNTLKGVNNIWADTGDTAVEYKQDIQTYIDSRLSSGTRSLSLVKAPVETEETKQEEQEGDEDVNR